MFTKICPRCGKRSYSASSKPWICPYCGEDMSDLLTEEEKRRKEKNLPKRRD